VIFVGGESAMNDEKFLTIHFVDGTKMELSFPTQIKNSMTALVDASERLLKAEKLVVECEGKVLVIPWTSVKYVEATAVPEAALPVGSIKRAKVLKASPI